MHKKDASLTVHPIYGKFYYWSIVFFFEVMFLFAGLYKVQEKLGLDLY
jgi:hypothetical protein